MEGSLLQSSFLTGERERNHCYSPFRGYRKTTLGDESSLFQWLLEQVSPSEMEERYGRPISIFSFIQWVTCNNSPVPYLYFCWVSPLPSHVQGVFDSYHHISNPVITLRVIPPQEPAVPYGQPLSKGAYCQDKVKAKEGEMRATTPLLQRVRAGSEVFIPLRGIPIPDRKAPQRLRRWGV